METPSSPIKTKRNYSPSATSERSEIPGTISQKKSPKISTLVIFSTIFPPNSSKFLQDVNLVFPQVCTFFLQKFSYFPKSLQFLQIE